jgi:hypothetical protein
MLPPVSLPEAPPPTLPPVATDPPVAEEPPVAGEPPVLPPVPSPELPPVLAGGVGWPGAAEEQAAPMTQASSNAVVKER